MVERAHWKRPNGGNFVLIRCRDKYILIRIYGANLKCIA